MKFDNCNAQNVNVIDAYPLPHSDLTKNHRKRNFISNSSDASFPLPSNARDLPDFSTCHSCGIRDGGLQVLDSQWRIVLLCGGCLALIRSAEVCSYCFCARDADVLVCRSCSRGVHLCCVLVQRGYIALPECDPVSFTCIDCRAIPRKQLNNQCLPRLMLENVIRNVSSAAKKKAALAVRARSDALMKADKARVSMEIAFDAILFARDAAAEEEKLDVEEERLDVHVQRVMNGSTKTPQRKSQTNSDYNLRARKHRGNSSANSMCSKSMNGSPETAQRESQTNSDHHLRVKKVRGNSSANSMCTKSMKRRGRINEKARVCRKDEAVSKSNRTSISEKKYVEKEQMKVDAHHANGSTEVITFAKKKRLNFNAVLKYDKVVNYDGFTLISCSQSADSNCFIKASKCGRGKRTSRLKHK